MGDRGCSHSTADRAPARCSELFVLSQCPSSTSALMAPKTKKQAALQKEVARKCVGKRSAEEPAAPASQGVLALVAGAPPKRAKPGEGMDAAQVSTMLTFLKYRATKAKDPEMQAEAKEVLNLYSQMDPSKKKAFVEKFLLLPKEKVKGALKNFVASFEEYIDHKHERDSQVQEGLVTRGEVLRHKGYAIADFPSVDVAFKAADKFIRENQEMFGTGGKDELDKDGDPYFDRFYYVQATSIEHHRQTQQNKFAVFQQGEEALKSAACAAGLLPLGAGSSGDGGIKLEYPHYAGLQEALSSVKKILAQGQKLHQEGTTLFYRLKALGKHDDPELMNRKALELGEGLKTFQGALSKAMEMACDAECYQEGSDPENLRRAKEEIEAMNSTLDHHIGGFRESMKKLSSLVSK